ncbi:HNH endonuclease [Gordonia phage PhorbesPhlower]|nr:HNH endonuclease [Gordonia phage PhorbesPhlower]UUG69935.1 HNH endonuclease [Gordonia phage Morkie]
MSGGRNTTIRDRHRNHIRRGKPPCSYTHCLYPGTPIDYDADSHLDPLSFTVDHTIPINHGGTDTLDNKTAMHRACNRHKSDKLDPSQDSPATRQFITHRTW